MRPIQLHVPSLAIGVAACALVLLSMGQAAPGASTSKPAVPPPPRDKVIIRESVPYTVPKGKVFVLTAIGTANFTGGNAICTLKLNGEIEVSGGTWQVGVGGTALFAGGTVQAVAPGFAAGADSTIEVEDNHKEFGGRAWGYLVPE